MGQDIREMFREEEMNSSERLEQGHKERFKNRLDASFPIPSSGRNFFMFKIAAVLLVAFGVGMLWFQSDIHVGETEVVDTKNLKQEESVVPKKEVQLSDVSPEFQKIENYYLASLNLELAKLEVNENNKEIIDSFMRQLSGLDKEYQRLNREFREIGANEQTIEAMIANLQFRLELLQKVKDKIKEVRTSKTRIL